MAYFNLPTTDQLLAMTPQERAPIIEWITKISPNMAVAINMNLSGGNKGDLDANWNAFTKGWVNDPLNRIKESVGNIKNAGHDPNATGTLQEAAQSRIKQLQNLWNSAPASIKGNEQIADYQSWVSGTPAIDPYGPGGALANIQGGAGNQAYTPAQQNQTAQTKITEPMVGMQAPDGHVEFIPQSQVEAKKAERWGVINGTPEEIAKANNIPVPSTSGATNAPGKKEIVSDGMKLYAKDETGKLTYIPDQKTLENYVNQQGYADANPRPSVTAQQVQSGNANTTPEATNTTGGATGTGTGTTGTTNPQTQWVNDLYQKYFDRPATQSEMDNWLKESPQSLEQFLGNEAKTYGFTSKYFQDKKNVDFETGKKKITDSNLPDDIKKLFLLAYEAYPEGIEANSEGIINTFNDLKNSTIDPYFKQLSDIAINDVQRNREMLNLQREMELEAQRTTAGLNIKQAKEGLENSGMTFTGKAVENLGAQSAYSQTGTEGTPAQVPFGGLFYEGTVNQANRLSASSSAARYKEAVENMGAQAEKYLGSDQANLMGLTGGVGTGIEGTLATDKSAKYGATLNDIIDQYRQRAEGTATKNYFE